MKFFSAFLAFAMVLSLLSPIASAATNEELIKQFKPDQINESVMQQKAAIAEQLDLLGGEARLHKDLQTVSGNQQVAVIVHLSEKSVALQKGINKLAGKNFSAADESLTRSKVNAQQTMSKKEMKIKNINFEVGYSFDTVLNGFAATVKAEDIPKLLEVSGVKLVEPDTEVHAFSQLKPKKSIDMKNKEMKTVENTTSDLIKTNDIEAKMNTSISFLGIEKLWNEGFEGQGIKVAVLDTGIDANHPEFAANYKGGKNFVPHTGSDYARPRADNDGSETSPLDRPANRPEFNERGSAFYTSHGTHVAGTIAAMGNNPYGIKGIAPKVDLYSYRVLGAYGSGSTSGIIKAIDTAVIEKMDVINLSLGGGANSETDGGSFAINNAMLAGTIAAVATGNSGPKRGTMGTPSTARLGIAVANTTNPEQKYNGKATIAAGSYQYAKQLNLMGTTFGKKLETQLQGEFELIAVPGNGTAADYAGIDAAGKVALISRGEISFVDKIAFAKQNGAIATIIHNFAGGSNAPGESGTFLGDSFEFIPTFDMSVTDATEIRAALQTEKATISFGQFASTSTTGDEVNDSSSRGPSTPNFDIKPDVSAPGTNIMSSIPQYGADFPEAKYDQSYDRFTGTSMATPHIAGIAALVKQANPSWNAFDVKVALSNTAKLLDTAKYDVFSQGAGRVDAYAAAHPSVLAYAIDTANNNGVEVENLKGTVTFGPQSLAKDLTVTKQIRVKDMKGKGGSYAVSVDVKKAFGDATLTIDKPTFNLAGEELLTVTMKASKNTNIKPGDEFLGYIHITGGENEVSLPFAADFGGAAADEFKDFKISETDLSFDGDGYKDTALLSFTLTGDVTTNFIEIWDILNPESGEHADGYIGYLHAGTSLGAGSYTLQVSGKYFPWTSGASQTNIPDGLYTMDFSGKTVSGNPASLGGYVGPIVVKTTKPVIEGTIATGQASGTVTDKYIDYNTELAKYGLEYELNEKLQASYIVTKNGVTSSAVPFKLKADGTFTFPIEALDEKKDSVTVVVKDAAGNEGEFVLFGSKPIDPNEPVDTKPMDPVASEPIEANKYVSSFGINNTAISTTKNGKANYSYELKENPKFATTVDVLDPMAFTATPKSDGKIGDILFDVKKELKVNATFDGVFTNAEDYSKGKLKDGFYGLRVTGTSASNEKMAATIQPVFVKSTAPAITVTSQGNVISGSVTDKFIDYKPAVKQKFNKEYDINTYLSLTAVVRNEEGVRTDNAITLEQDGSFSADLKGLAGDSIVTLVAQDIAQNKSQESIKVVAEDSTVTYAVNKDEIALKIGETTELKVTETTTKADGTTEEKDVTADATFTSADPTIATVEGSTVTAVAAGTSEITVTVKDFTAKVAVEVAAVAGQDKVVYSLSKKEMKLGVGQQEQLIVTETTTKADGTVIEKDATPNVRFNVVNNTIATVQNGLVTAKSAGQTQVRVLIPGQETLFVYLEVSNVPQDIITYSINKKQLTLGVGQQEQLIITQTTDKVDGTIVEKDITPLTKFAAVNNTVAKVSKGLVSALKAGKTQVKVMIPGQDERFVYIEVKEVPQDIVSYSVNETDLKLQVGEQEQLKVVQTTVKPYGQILTKDATGQSKYNVVNNTFATVQLGLVTAKKAGKTQVRVLTPDGDVILVYLTVKDDAVQNTVSYAVNKDNVTLQIGGKEQLTVTEKTTTPTGTVTEKDVTADTKFQSANPNVVTLNKGLVTAVAAGETTIAVTHPKFTTAVTAIVEAADVVTTELRVTPAELTLVSGNQKTVSVQSLQTTNGQAVNTDVTNEAAYSDFDSAIVSVQQGTITAISPGATEITVKHGTETATIRVTVETAPVVEPEMQKVVISEADIASFINDKKAKQVIINVPAYDKEIAIEFSETVLTQIVKSKKELLFTSNGTTIEFEDDATKELLNKTGGNATIILGKAISTTYAEALSDEISIALYSGFGESKQSVTAFKEDIEITIQIDDSQLAKNAKVEVLDLSTNKMLKAKAKKGIVEFETNSTGTFIVIKK